MMGVLHHFKGCIHACTDMLSVISCWFLDDSMYSADMYLHKQSTAQLLLGTSIELQRHLHVWRIKRSMYSSRKMRASHPHPVCSVQAPRFLQKPALLPTAWASSPGSSMSLPHLVVAANAYKLHSRWVQLCRSSSLSHTRFLLALEWIMTCRSLESIRKVCPCNK